MATFVTKALGMRMAMWGIVWRKASAANESEFRGGLMVSEFEQDRRHYARSEAFVQDFSQKLPAWSPTVTKCGATRIELLVIAAGGS